MLRPSLSQEGLWEDGRGFNYQLFTHSHKSLFCQCVLGKGAHCPFVAQLASCWTSMTSSNISRIVGVRGTESLNESRQKDFFAHVLQYHSLQIQPLGIMFAGLEHWTCAEVLNQLLKKYFLLTSTSAPLSFNLCKKSDFFLFDTWSHYEALTGLKFTILIPQPHKC